MKVRFEFERITHRHPSARVVRSYVLDPYRMVVDHRSGDKTADVDRVLDGDLDALLTRQLAEHLSAP